MKFFRKSKTISSIMGTILTVGITCCLGNYYRNSYTNTTDIITRDSKLKNYLNSNITQYKVPIILIPCLNQMIYNEFLSNHKNIHYERKLLDLPDGGVVSLDYAENQSNKNTNNKINDKIILILHGLTGGSNNSYIKDIVHCFISDPKYNSNYKVICINYRGINDTPLKTPKGYHIGHTEDLEYIIEYLKKEYNTNIANIANTTDNTKPLSLYLIGTSMGANIISKYLTKKNKETNNIQNSSTNNTYTNKTANNPIKAFISISNPINIIETEKANYGKILDIFLLKQMKGYLTKYKEVFKNNPELDINKALDAKHYRDYDSEITCKVFNSYGKYFNVDDYYYKEQCMYDLKNIKVNSLFFNSEDDKLSPYYSYKKIVEEVFGKEKGSNDNDSKDSTDKSNPSSSNMAMIKTKRGGHCTWFMWNRNISSSNGNGNGRNIMDRWFIEVIKKYFDYLELQDDSLIAVGNSKSKI